MSQLPRVAKCKQRSFQNAMELFDGSEEVRRRVPQRQGLVVGDVGLGACPCVCCRSRPDVAQSAVPCPSRRPSCLQQALSGPWPVGWGKASQEYDGGGRRNTPVIKFRADC